MASAGRAFTAVGGRPPPRAAWRAPSVAADSEATIADEASVSSSAAATTGGARGAGGGAVSPLITAVSGAAAGPAVRAVRSAMAAAAASSASASAVADAPPPPPPPPPAAAAAHLDLSILTAALAPPAALHEPDVVWTADALLAEADTPLHVEEDVAAAATAAAR